MNLDESRIISPFSIQHRIARALWWIVWTFLFRPSPIPFHFWRRALLRLFGGKIAKHAHPYPSCRIFAPWNLTMEPFSCLAHRVDCYNVAPVRLGPHATISQDAFICTASHDVTLPDTPLVTKAIVIEKGAWVFARAFIGPGVTISEGAVVAACSVVVKNVNSMQIVGGNPARLLKERKIVSR